MFPFSLTYNAFLEPALIHARRNVHLFTTRRETAKQFCRTSRSPSRRACRRQGMLNVMNLGTDTNEESFDKLASDIREYLKTCPDSELNPLSYITLRKAGRLDLISRIMNAGGYINVSRTLGVRVDETQFIPPPPTFTSSSKLSSDVADDYNASLVVGRDLEERLNTIEQVMKKDGDRVDPARVAPSLPVSDDVPTGEELRLQNQIFQPAIIDQPIPLGERFTLTTGMRIGLLCLAAVSAIGLGRSSHGVVSDDVISSCRWLNYGLLFAHLVLSIYAGAMAARKRRNRFLWFTKVLVGGPLGIQYLRGLDVLPE